MSDSGANETESAYAKAMANVSLDELKKYRGQHIAVSLQSGAVLAAAVGVDELHVAVKEKFPLECPPFAVAYGRW